MELTWLPDTPQARSRTRALRACPTCQRRKLSFKGKKRCRHVVPHSRAESARSPEQLHGTNNAVQNSRETAGHRGSNDPVLEAQSVIASPVSASPTCSRPDRFVGDLNPEAVIREKLDGRAENPLRDRIGLWITSENGEESRQNLASVRSFPAGQPSQRTQASHSAATLLHQRYIFALKACDRLPLTMLENLIPTYFSRVNHILPLVEKDFFGHAQAEGTPSVFLERAICLVAAKYKPVSFDLRTASDGPPVTSRQFCSDIYRGLVVAMDAGLEKDRVTRIRILALMSLHCEGYEGAEAASMHLCQAIHQAQTAGLHLDRPSRMAEDSLSKLFWCLWTLDKMHASLGGRPVLLADRDIGIERPDVKASRSKSAFDVWFAISDLLSTVISLYRPSADSITLRWEEGFPPFEELVGDHTQGELDFTTLGLLELYYHAVSILSCRSNVPERPDASKPSYIRQGLSAVRIHSIVASECPHGLPPLPILPYAVTLSMGVSYQQFRSGKLITHLNRAKADIANCCSLLEELSTHWSSAEAMARLGQKALHQIDMRREHIARREGRQQNPAGGESAPNPSYNPSGVFAGEDPRNFSDTPSAATTHGITEAEPFQPLPTSLAHDGLADMDMLFGDFLDLSLPTNFWDPVFSTDEHGTEPAENGEG